MRTPESPKTLYDKIFDEHVVRMEEDGTATLYIDRHLVHEVTSAQAFEGLRMNNRPLWRKSSIVATADHNTPTTGWEAGMEGITDPISKLQVTTLDENIRQNGCAAFFPFLSRGQGVIHVMGPEEGATLPGMTVVCGDSHTSTHGACAAIAFGIGTSEVEHVMATQTLLTKKMKNMRVHVEGNLQPGVFAKDLALYIIGKIGTAGGTGCAIEFDGAAIRALSMETLHSDEGAKFDIEVNIQAEDVVPMVTWGTSPEMVAPITGCTPIPEDQKDPVKREGWERAYQYMDLKPGTPITSIAPNNVFIGSCTNGRIEDLRAAAYVVRKLGKKVAPTVKQALVVPGSGLVREQAEEEGLDKIFIEAGFQWRRPGCSMCLAMNADRLEPGDRCASTSNRNFEGRQGNKSRTHLCSPAMAAAAAIEGHFVDVRKLF